MDLLLRVFSLLMSAVLQIAFGRATNAADLGIIDGHKIKITSAPFMAGLFDNVSQVCGGCIVHEKFILTSALCVRTGPRIERVHIGSNHVNLYGTFIDVDKELCHEDFGQVSAKNDICLLKLREEVPFSKTVAKVGLSHENDIPVGTTVNVTGWGIKVLKTGRFPTFLQQATISVVSDDACRRIDHLMPDNSFCAGSRGRDTCEGDAGGPLTENNVQVGIVSYKATPTCGLLPSFYTKVSKYIDWINSTISNNL